MLRASRRLRIIEELRAIKMFAIPLTTSKYCDELRESLSQELDSLNGFDPTLPMEEPKNRPLTDQEQKETSQKVLELFAMKKRLNGV